NLLAQVYLRALRLARDNGFSSIAFPCISTGHYFYPHDRAARIALSTIITFLTNIAPDLDVYHSPRILPQRLRMFIPDLHVCYPVFTCVFSFFCMK
ncbi:macro domain-containing protein, partial [Salmonella enterica]